MYSFCFNTVNIHWRSPWIWSYRSIGDCSRIDYRDIFAPGKRWGFSNPHRIIWRRQRFWFIGVILLGTTIYRDDRRLRDHFCGAPHCGTYPNKPNLQLRLMSPSRGHIDHPHTHKRRLTANLENTYQSQPQSTTTCLAHKPLWRILASKAACFSHLKKHLKPSGYRPAVHHRATPKSPRQKKRFRVGHQYASPFCVAYN